MGSKLSLLIILDTSGERDVLGGFLEQQIGPPPPELHRDHEFQQPASVQGSASHRDDQVQQIARVDDAQPERQHGRIDQMLGPPANPLECQICLR